MDAMDTRSRALTVPNLLSAFRILLVPVMEERSDVLKPDRNAPPAQAVQHPVKMEVGDAAAAAAPHPAHRRERLGPIPRGGGGQRVRKPQPVLLPHEGRLPGH